MKDGPVGVITHSSETEMTDKVHDYLVKEANRLKSREVQLAESVKEARAYLEESAKTFKKSWLDWCDESKLALEEMRQLKLAIAMESRQVQSAVKDMAATLEANRDAFAKAKEVVECLERLQKLEDSGFMARLADTLLKLL